MHPCGCRWHRAALWLSSSLLCIGGVPSIHSTVSELLGCPRDLAAVNSAAENFGVHAFLQFCLDIFLGEGIAGAFSFLVFFKRLPWWLRW